MSDGNGIPREFIDSLYSHLTESQDKYSLTNTVVDKNDVPKSNLMDSKMVPQKIAEEMRSYDKVIRKVMFDFTGLSLPITFFIYSPHANRILAELQVILPAIRWLVATHMKYKTAHDASKPEPLVVHLFMSGAKKRFPETSDVTISYEHCNAAVTRACNANGGEIMIYREEEWEKTLLHELCHSLCLDMAAGDDGGKQNESETNDGLKQIFHLPGKPMFRETHCELWATILYCAAIAHNHIRTSEIVSLANFKAVFQECFEIERHHAFIQTAKILRFWKVDWCDFLKHHMCKTTNVDRAKQTIPKEETNVFCYFILRTILLHDMDETVRVIGPSLKRSFDPASLVKHIQNIAYNEDFELEIQTHDRVTQVILSRIHSSRTLEPHKSEIVSHINENFRMSALSGWMI